MCRNLCDVQGFHLHPLVPYGGERSSRLKPCTSHTFLQIVRRGSAERRRVPGSELGGGESVAARRVALEARLEPALTLLR
ncbi:hypothetical protein B0H03_10186 [Rathayibacter iranicus NCPPB 2253 = VKM Ac-1602]|uniref:Uncharacterized protein n=1 Tax=Rathayibacter iranicus NCPPB 2253 = VKM Ac-1602 TaxID=1328868 RepID=A0ABX5LGQ4_9MICO|nr:hypothetical protein B0H03_10186 [Rathayibacter iranicus NCPPB 2253 = VKM Ac-1602]